MGWDLIILSYLFYYLDRQARTNSVDIDQMSQNVTSEQGLHCLQLTQQL